MFLAIMPCPDLKGLKDIAVRKTHRFTFDKKTIRAKVSISSLLELLDKDVLSAIADASQVDYKAKS